MKTKNPTLDFVQNVNRAGVGTLRYRLTAEEVKKLRAAELVSHEEAVKTLLGFLRTPRTRP